jgi:hypothetical protein
VKRSKESVEAAPPKPFCPFPGLRIGSIMTTRRGIEFRVREAVVMVAESGGESPSVYVERIQDGQTTELFLTVGMFANLARGAMHRPGSGPRIDWSRAPRRPLTSSGHLGLQQPPRLLLRRGTPR